MKDFASVTALIVSFFIVMALDESISWFPAIGVATGIGYMIGRLRNDIN